LPKEQVIDDIEVVTQSQILVDHPNSQVVRV
jgi:hypothetical protein